jgi:hypothetical protein
MMAKCHVHLFDRIANFGALHKAAKRAILCKRRKPGAASFFANLETELLRLERQLRSSTYRPGRYVTIEVHDPKRRHVSAAPLQSTRILGACATRSSKVGGMNHALEA